MTKSQVLILDDSVDFDTILQEVCKDADLPHPVVLNKHTSHWQNFRITKFSLEDFIETVEFDFLELELVVEKKKQNKHN